MGQKLSVLDPSGLTDAEWVAVNKVSRAYEAGGFDAFWDELERLDDEVLQITVAGAFFPNVIRQVLIDYMEEQGMTINDLRELLRKAESPTRDQ